MGLVVALREKRFSSNLLFIGREDYLHINQYLNIFRQVVYSQMFIFVDCGQKSIALDFGDTVNPVYSAKNAASFLLNM